MKCPGQDTRYWSGVSSFEVPCPKCGNIEEFFKDEASRKCKKCGSRVLNPHMDFGCASYCKYAKQCFGDLPPELLAQRKELLKDRVAVEVKKYFGTDFKRIGHASKVARYAEEIAKEEGAEPAIVLPAAYLHDIGIKDAEQKYNSSAARYQEELGPPIAREILTDLGAEPEVIDEVCDIVGHHHHPGKEETTNFKALYDADFIVNLEETNKKSPMSKESLESVIKKSFLTETGAKIARRVFLGKDA
jgi:hypothetical protein